MVMVNALDSVDKDETVPRIQVIVTGRGPQKALYEQIFCNRNSEWTKTNIRQAWLEVDDYPKVVGSCDLGICLHTSSSGYDLPMKVVDMFSAGLPCLAIGGYPSVGELVKAGDNTSAYGRLFSSSEELAQQMAETLRGFDQTDETGGTETLRTWRQNLKEFSKKENSW